MRKFMWMAMCLAVLPTVAFGEAKKISLKIGYQPGTYVMTLKTNMDNVSTMSAGQSMTQNIETTMVMELEASQKDKEGMQHLRMTFKRTVQSITGGPMSMTYDSANPQGGNPMLAAMYRALLDKPIEMKLDKDGKAVSITGMDAIWDAMAKENPGMAPMANSMKEQLGDKYISQIVDWSYRLAPSSPVAVGDSWENDQQLDLPMIGQMQVKQTSTLKEVKDSPQGPIAVIAFTSTLEKKGAQDANVAGPMHMTIEKAKIAQSGTTEIAVNTGMLLSSLSDQKLSMQLTMRQENPPQGQEGAAPMSMDMQQSGKVEMTIREGKYVPPATMPAGASQPAGVTRPVSRQPAATRPSL